MDKMNFKKKYAELVSLSGTREQVTELVRHCLATNEAIMSPADLFNAATIMQSIASGEHFDFYEMVKSAILFGFVESDFDGLSGDFVDYLKMFYS